MGAVPRAAGRSAPARSAGAPAARGGSRAPESWGKGPPCRIGSVRGAEALGNIARGVNPEGNFALVEELCDTMLHASLCGLGGMAPYPVLSAMTHFNADFRRP